MKTLIFVFVLLNLYVNVTGQNQQKLPDPYNPQVWGAITEALPSIGSIPMKLDSSNAYSAGFAVTGFIFDYVAPGSSMIYAYFKEADMRTGKSSVQRRLITVVSPASSWSQTFDKPRNGDKYLSPIPVSISMSVVFTGFYGDNYADRTKYTTMYSAGFGSILGY